MFIEKNMLGRTQPSHLGDLGTGRLHLKALPDEFSHFHSIKFLVQKMNGKANHEHYFSTKLIETNGSPFPICSGGLEEKCRWKALWALANMTVLLKEPLCYTSRSSEGGPICKDFSLEREGNSLDLVARRHWKTGRESKKEKGIIHDPEIT